MKLVLVFLVSILLTYEARASSFEEKMVYPGDSIGIKPVSDYVNIWWQWSYSMPQEKSPVSDLTGEYCGIAQKGDVWFLAGGYGSSKIKRSCTIPKDKYIFFPIINMVYWPHYKNSLSCEDAKKLSALNNNELLSIEIMLDDEIALNPANTRISSVNCFDLLGLIPQKFNPPKIYPAATDGYWVMLKPLSIGDHVLTFKAQYNREKGAYSKMLQEIEYQIKIE